MQQKLDEFDDQLATQIEDIEQRLQQTVKSSVTLQRERVRTAALSVSEAESAPGQNEKEAVEEYLSRTGA